MPREKPYPQEGSRPLLLDDLVGAVEDPGILACCACRTS